ncbi:hypothetical protein [Nostoc sp. CCY 9925]|uniref:hypothetical protein n=1 Tax=Nostoc sp. CCY 9925 TaxID=3103865 RepID=UPI0039C657BD
MSVESLANYESWDLTMNQLPKRSHLYSLKPIGFGTPTVESFTSYLQRLAAAHGVSIASLIRYKITPLFIQSHQPPNFLKIPGDLTSIIFSILNNVGVLVAIKTGVKRENLSISLCCGQ